MSMPLFYMSFHSKNYVKWNVPHKDDFICFEWIFKMELTAWNHTIIQHNTTINDSMVSRAPFPAALTSPTNLPTGEKKTTTS